MIYSMTAYTSQNIEISGATARWEIRSINHRYLELSFKLPDFLHDLEYVLRDICRQCLSRGKVDCALKLEWAEGGKTALALDFNLIEQLIAANQTVYQRFGITSQLSIADILRWPTVVRIKEENIANIQEPLLQSFKLALQDLIAARAREGGKLAVFIRERLKNILRQIQGVREKLPEIQAVYRLKFQEKYHVLECTLDPDRLEQAIMHLIQKMDISEELDRLKVHLMEIERVLNEDKIVGRRLDFLMQELNREANTLASKAADHAMSHMVVLLKVWIEEMREQIQNLE